MTQPHEAGQNNPLESLPFMPPNQGESARDWVYRNILNGIICVDILPGAVLTEQETAKVFDVSRTPVREAFLQLSQNGFVEMTPPRGSRASLIDPLHVEEANYMRVCLEGRIHAAACERLSEENYIQLKAFIDMQRVALNKGDARRFFELDQQMHRTIYAVCAKARIWDYLWNFAVHLIRVRYLHIKNFTPEYREKMLRDHHEMVDAIKEKQTNRAAELAETHLDHVMDAISGLQQQYPYYFVNQKFR